MPPRRTTRNLGRTCVHAFFLAIGLLATPASSRAAILSEPFVSEDPDRRFRGRYTVAHASDGTVAFADAQYSLSGIRPGALVVARRAPDGTSWQRTFEEPPFITYETGAIAFDSEGNLLVAGRINDARVFLFKYSQDGERLWASQYGDPVLSPGSAPRLFLDARDQPVLVYANGATKFSRQGERLWSTPFPPRRLTHASSRLDPDDALILTGWACPEPAACDPTAVRFGTFRLDSQGRWGTSDLWKPEDAPVRGTTPMRVDALGVVVWGVVGDSAIFSRFTPDGQRLWQTAVPLPAAPTSQRLVTADDGAVFYATLAEAPVNDPVLARIDPDGRLAWTRTLASPAGQPPVKGFFPTEILPDALGGAVLCSLNRIENTGLPDAMFSRVFRISRSGAVLAAETAPGWLDLAPTLTRDQELRLAFLRSRPGIGVEVRLAIFPPTAQVARVGDPGADGWTFALRSDLATPPVPLLRTAQAANLDAWVDGSARPRAWTSSHPLASATDAASGNRKIPGGHAQLRLDLDNQAIVARWTAANAGSFRLAGTFYGGPDGAPDSQPVQKRPNLAIYINGSTRTNIPPATTAAATATAWAFDLPLALRAGDVVELAAHRPSTDYWPSITLDAAIARADLPPTVAITQPVSGQTFAPNQAIQVILDASDPEGSQAGVDLLVDGRVVHSLTAPPYRFDLPALPLGEHRFEARAYDAAGLGAAAPAVLVYVDQAPAPNLFIPPAEVHRAVFNATLTAALEEAAGTEYGLGMDLLLQVTARMRREFPEAPSELLQLFLQEGLKEVRRLPGAPGGGQGAMVGSRSLAGTPVTKQPWEGVREVSVGVGCAAITWVTKEKWAWDKCTYYGNALVKAVDEVGSYLADRPAREFDRKFREEGGQVIYDAAQKDPVIAAGFDATLGAELKTRIADSSRDLVDRFDQLDKANTGLANQLRAVLTDTGAIRSDLKAFEAMAENQFHHINSGINIQIGIARENLRQTSTLVGYLARQEAASLKQTEEAGKQAAYQQQLAGMQAGVTMLGTLIGFGDPKLGKKVSAVGTAGIKLFDAVTKFSAGIGSAGGWASAALTGNVAGAVFSLVSSFFGGGPSPEELILKELGVIKRMIVDLGKHLDQRFDRVDASLNRIYGEMLTQFAAVEFRLGVLQRDVDSLQVTTTQIRDLLDRVELNQFTLAREQQRKDFNTTRTLLEAYDPITGSLLSRSQFETFAAEFATLASGLATNEISAPWRNTGLTDRDVAARLKDEWTANVAYLAALAADRGWLPGARFFRPGLVNPSEWALGANAFADLASQWPDLARTPAARAWLERIADQGRTLESARRELALETVAGQSRPNRALFAHLIRNYREKAAALGPLLSAFELEQRERLIAGDDLSRKAAARRLDLWGALDQDAGFEPEAVRSTNSIRWSPLEGGLPPLSFVSPLPNPTGFHDRLVREGLVITETAELLRFGKLAAGYHHITFTDVRTRDTCVNVAYTVDGGKAVNYSQVVRESHFQIDCSVLYTPSDNDPVTSTLLRLRFTHPAFSFHNLDQYMDYPPGYVLRDRAANNQTTGSRDLTAYCEVQDLWANNSARVTTHWNGGQDPDGRIRRSIAAARSDLSSRATTLQTLPASLGQSLLAQIESRFRQLQHAHYDALRNRLESAGDPLAEAGSNLSSARETLRAFLRLAFPETYETDDAIRSFFTGEEPLPDLAELRTLCNRGQGISANSLDHRDRIHFPRLVESRIASFERLLNRRLDQLDRDREPEPLPLVADTLRRLDEVRTLITQASLPPALGLIDATPSRLRLRLYGEPNAAYVLQASPDLISWSDLPERATHGTVREVPVPGERGRFWRAVRP